ncbi:MAG: PEP-CTERM sorting domain-containing protein [Verrucomicrobiota bacterium]
MNPSPNYLYASLIAGFALAASTANAAFSLYQDFQSLTVGYDISGSDPNENFTVSNTNAGTASGGFTVAADPTTPGNNVLRSDAVSRAFAGALTTLTIPNNSTATLFYRIYRLGSNAPDVNFGVSDQTANLIPTANAGLDYQSQLNVSGGVGNAQNSEFSPRNGGGTSNTDVIWTANTYFGIYQVVNTSTNTTQFYYQRVTDPAPILLTSVPGAVSNQAFRNAGTRPGTAMSHFLMVAGVPAGGGTQDVFYLDDIYIDLAGANLTAPVLIPEPATGCLMMAGACCLLLRRRPGRS